MHDIPRVIYICVFKTSKGSEFHDLNFFTKKKNAFAHGMSYEEYKEGETKLLRVEEVFHATSENS
jgi:hypothetical protein